MTINDKARYEKLQYDINRETAKISALYQLKLISIDILQDKISYKFINTSLWKAFVKKTKSIEEQEKKQEKGIKNRIEQQFLGTDK